MAMLPANSGGFFIGSLSSDTGRRKILDIRENGLLNFPGDFGRVPQAIITALIAIVRRTGICAAMRMQTTTR